MMLIMLIKVQYFYKGSMNKDKKILRSLILPMHFKKFYTKAKFCMIEASVSYKYSLVCCRFINIT